MARSTIDFGIDLGTTNSAIAVLKGVRPEVIKNNLDADITPSAVYLNKAGNVTVGARAKNKLEEERSAEDAYIEFKRRMGTDADYLFRTSGLRKTPEELSAEILKSLRGNVLQRLDEDISAAVITIPAAFAQRQCVATKRAAELAGFTQCPLLQEPVAASLAYGFQADTAKRSFWMVFDFGGGTFDAAVMKAEDGDLQVVNHGGDNFLGGADIDWAIIETYIIPQLQDSYNLPDFRRGNLRWRAALAKLKRAVEMAKIDLSRAPSAALDGCVFEDEDGEEVDLEGFELTQAQVKRVAEPLILRAADKCRAVLAEKHLSPSAIERVLLVGGPTLAPYFRETLGEALGIPLDHSVDPLTVVAQGAAIFAGTQRIERGLRASATAAPMGAYKVTLNYSPIGPDDDPAVTGEVAMPTGGVPTEGLRIAFVNRNTRWSSGEIPLNAEGKFRLRLRAVPGEQNIFDITLRDSIGNALPTDVKEIAYTVGATIKAQITCNDISVELSGNAVKLAVPKGTAYPFKKSVRGVITNVALKRGEPGQVTIPILEAINGNAGTKGDHNIKLGDLVIKSEDIRRDLPLGSDLELTLTAKEPGSINATAYVELLDETFSVTLRYDRESISEEELWKEAEREKARIPKVLEKAGDLVDAETRQKLETLPQELDGLWRGIEDPAEAQKIQQRIIELRIIIDEVEDTVEIPAKLHLIEIRLDAIDKQTGHMTAGQMTAADELRRRYEEQKSKRDPAAIEALNEEVGALLFDIYSELPEYWKGFLGHLYGKREQMSDQREADLLFAQGARATERDDIEAMRKTVIRLLDLLPPEARENAQRGHNSGITML